MAETQYSTKEEINAFITRLVEGDPNSVKENGVTDKSRPMLVLDVDGNFVIGYNLKPGVSMTLAEGDNPDNQAIPSGTDLQQLLAQGKIEPEIFAARNMDVRVHPEIAQLMNESIADNAHPDRKFDLVILTSRRLSDTLKILKESGVEHPEKISMVVDSGASIFVDGQRHDVRPLNKEEQKFLKDLDKEKKALEIKINNILTETGLDPTNRPTLYLEEKGIASNLHYRAILQHYGQKEHSELDKAIAAAIRSRLENYIAEKGPKENGKPIFKLLDAPAAIEIKIAQVDKGKALRAVVDAATTAGYTPSALVFSGDDINKVVDGKPSPGTDYSAFAEISKIQEETGIPTYGMHTHHPLSGKLSDPAAVPHPDKSAKDLGVKPDLTIQDPQANAELVVEITKRARDRAQEIISNAVQTTGAGQSRRR